MKNISLTLAIVVVATIFFSCGGAETKVDSTGDEMNKEVTGNEREAEAKIPESGTAPAAKSDSSTVIPVNNEILAKIDNYLVSIPLYATPPAGASIHNATVIVKNTLNNITFQKVIVEVNMLTTDGNVLRNDFYPIQNLEPGDEETINIPNTPGATSIKCHVVKVKSNELTRGEMVMTGMLFNAGK
jgi:hypothetical protein